jgi:SAM-dependent methyltransferase
MFETGKPAQFPAEGAIAGERSFAPGYRHELVQKWIPLLPGVEQKLTAGGRALDFACGAGLASIILAKAFPKSEFAGYDPYAPSIRRARERAKKEGVADRVQFFAADATKLPRGRYDLITIFNSMHHFNDPILILRHCREALTAHGTCFIVDLDLSPNPEDNINLAGRVAYAVMTLSCLQDSIANGGAGLGAELNETVLKDLAAKSGFSHCRKLAGSTPTRAFYELRS